MNKYFQYLIRFYQAFIGFSRKRIGSIGSSLRRLLPRGALGALSEKLRPLGPPLQRALASIRRLWLWSTTSLRAHPKIWIFNFVFVAVFLWILIYALMQEDLPVYVVGEEDEYVVVLDLGHGGRDPGAVVRNVRMPGGSRVTIYEHGMVFDVGARLMRLLKAHDDYAVLPTVTDEAGNILISEMRIPLPPQRTILYTTPHCDLDEVPSTVSVNLRWILANARRMELLGKEDRKSTRVIFVSLHMDEVPQRSGGLTVYTPAREADIFFPEDQERYLRFFEAREWLRQMHSAALDGKAVMRSNSLARDIVGNFRRHRLAVCDEKTFRNRVLLQDRNSFIPAVIRYNIIETRVLLELANLADPDDQQHVLDPIYRERMAWAIYEAIVSSFREPDPLESGRVNPRGR